MTTPLLCLFSILICLTMGATDPELAPSTCFMHTRCGPCLREFNCIWVLNPDGVPDVCELYTNQTKYLNGTCSTCQLPDSSPFGLSSAGFCNPRDYIPAVVAPLMFLLAAWIFVVISKIKQNAVIQEKSLTNEYIEPRKEDKIDSVAMDWVWFWMLCSSPLMTMFISPFITLVFLLPTSLYCVCSLLYCLICFGYQRSIELYSFQYNWANRSPLTCLIEGREAAESKRIDNWNRHHLSVFVSDAAEDEVLEYFEYTRFIEKFASHTIVVICIGSTIIGFMVGMFFIIDPTILDSQKTLPLFILVAIIALACAGASDSLLIVTNKRCYYSEHVFFIPLFTSFTISDVTADIADGIVYDKVVPCLTGKNFYKGSNFFCYFFNEVNFIEYLRSKHIRVENDDLNQRIFLGSAIAAYSIIPASLLSLFLLSPLHISFTIFFMTASFLLYFALSMSYFRSIMRYTLALAERQRTQQEDGTANEGESLLDAGTKDSDL